MRRHLSVRPFWVAAKVGVWRRKRLASRQRSRRECAVSWREIFITRRGCLAGRANQPQRTRRLLVFRGCRPYGTRTILYLPTRHFRGGLTYFVPPVLTVGGSLG